MTSIKREYNVILRSCFHQNQRYALTTIVNAAFLGCVHAYFAKEIWNADSKRLSKTPFSEVLFMLPSRRRRYVYRRRHVIRNSRNVSNSGYCSSSIVTGMVCHMTSLQRGYNVILRSCIHQNQRFALDHVRKRTFLDVLNRAFWNAFIGEISMDATAFSSYHVWKRWFWPQELSFNAPRFESAFWNAFIPK